MPTWLLFVIVVAALSLVAPAGMFAATKSRKQAADAWKSWLAYIAVLAIIGAIAMLGDWMSH